MTSEIDKKPSLPKVPKLKKGRKKSDDGNYYIKTTASSLLPKYSGKNKLEIFISRNDKKILDQLESLFLNDFDLNHVICFAYQCIKNNHPKVEYFNALDKPDFNCSVKIKPAQETLEAILSYGKDDATSYLAHQGINILGSNLSLGFMSNFKEQC